MNLEQKFNIGSKNNSYQRVDANFLVDIFVGYNEHGQMSMVVIEEGKEVKISPSQFIHISLSKRPDGKLVLSFDLQDEAYKSIFFVFCKDMIFNIEQFGKKNAIAGAIRRWQYWKEVFGKKRSNLLEFSAIKGLVGELLVLKNIFMNKWPQNKAIESWMGPLLGHKDFEIEDTWYEIKSVNEQAMQIPISSIEQLESNIPGHLIIVRLEKTNETVYDAISASSLVKEITNLIQDPLVLREFQEKLLAMDFYPFPEYDSWKFSYKGMEMFRVDNEFPRITRKELSEYICDVKYTVLLNGINRFKETDNL
ncbi:MAG: PD-(D/E)XK motif protein [Elusimicrobia bacterium]|nr:PD-(D/E)XK motif protein [Elusimicrobiota bacterium]